MTSSKLRLLLYLILGSVVAAGPVAAQSVPAGRETSAASVEGYSLTQKMPVDPDAVVGTLPNGLKYYVRANGKPQRQAELRLVVRAGSVLEDDDQKGLAHFVEHMEFEGTRHFPGHSLDDFLSSLGLSIGADANAATGYDSTQYTLRVPTDVGGVLDRALLVLEDWAQAATFTDEGIERQRPIVLSEWRLHLGANERTDDQIRQVQMEGSRYAARSPIGDPTVIQNARREQLTRFYHDWYRPDLMAVIVVGDVDRNAVVNMIRQHFSPLTSPAPERPRQIFDVPERAGTRYAVVTDKETTITTVMLSDLRPARNQGSVGGYREIIRDQLFSDMLAARLDEVSQSANPPFLKAVAARGLFPAPTTRDEALLQALVPNDGVTRGLQALATELRRVAQFGFTDAEITRAKQSMMASYERSVTESPDRESSSRADEYTRNFMQDEALPTIWQELAFHRRFLPTITRAELNALTSDWFPDRNRLVVVSAPDAAGLVLPTQAQLAAAMNAAASARLTPYVDVATTGTLITAPPAKGSIVNTTLRPEAGITEWTLSNGATVVLKPTKLKEDQILFRATAPGGTSLASDADFPSARIADSVISAGGVGAFTGVQLDRMLSGKAVAVSPFISEVREGLGGGSTPQDLETMFQLLYLRFTAPRADPNAFALFSSEAKTGLANELASPDAVFNRAIADALTGGNKRRLPETPASVEQWNLEKALSFYKARFADASNFTFVFVGSFDIDTIKPLVETYIASLPATRAHETWKDIGVMPPPGVVERTVQKGIAPKSSVAIVFSGPFEYDDAHLLALRTMALILQSRLFDTIRQELGGTYSITATPETQKYPRPEYRIRIEWACDPARVSLLTRRVFDEIRFVQTSRINAGQMTAIRAGLLHEFDGASQENGYLLGQIVRRYEDGDAANVGAIENLPARIAALTPGAIEEAARTYLNTGRYVQVTLMPDSK